MIPGKRGRNHRRPEPLLPTFMAGDAPEGTKALVGAILSEMAAFPLLDAAAIAAADPSLERRAIASNPAGLDLYRALRGQPVQQRRNRRTHVSASLRHVRRREGRAPIGADFPAGHPARAMAWAYWGGVARWSAGSPARSQRPKRYWLHKANQLVELRRVADAFPGQPITHGLLNRAGLHRLAVVLTASDLEALATEAGLARNLAYRCPGYWTRDRVIAAYAALCAEYDVALTQHALASIGGAASSLRGRAGRAFPDFRSMQEAAATAHPGIRLTRRPTANDGLILDSWSEVVTYQAIRTAFPDSTADVHVVLPGGRRSCDVVVDGIAYVEVLQYSLESLQDVAAGSRRWRKYARQWVAKAAVYAHAGVAVVVVEPGDVHDRTRMAVKMAEVAAVLGVAPPAVTPVGAVRFVRGKGFWCFTALCEQVGDVARRLGRFPAAGELASAGCGHAANLLKQPGVRARVADAIGYAPIHRSWDDAGVVVGVSEYVRRTGRWPTLAKLQAAGDGALASAMQRLFRGRPGELRAAVLRACGTAFPPPRAPAGSRKDERMLADQVRPLAVRLGRMPSGTEMVEELGASAATAVSRVVGLGRMAGLLGLPYCGPVRRTDAEALAAVRRALEQAELRGDANRGFTAVVRAALGSNGIRLVRQLGGTAAVRRKLDELGQGGAGAGGVCGRGA